MWISRQPIRISKKPDPLMLIDEKSLKLYFYRKLHLLNFLLIYSLLGFYRNQRTNEFFPEGHPRRWEVTLSSIPLRVPQKLLLWDRLRLATLRDTKSFFLTPTWYGEHTRPFSMGVHNGNRCTYSPEQSTVGKRMAAVHFTTIPCEPNTAYKHN